MSLSYQRLSPIRTSCPLFVEWCLSSLTISYGCSGIQGSCRGSLQKGCTLNISIPMTLQLFAHVSGVMPPSWLTSSFIALTTVFRVSWIEGLFLSSSAYRVVPSAY
ncbi:hypothetical protein VNO77_03089 [Canavalia gladiata]|uniref:Uncharacterized protein n=1 Tax=Canavalia gladiata TaxID=3824 RepID=A0AAN9MU53_CANGL